MSRPDSARIHRQTEAASARSQRLDTLHASRETLPARRWMLHGSHRSALHTSLWLARCSQCIAPMSWVTITWVVMACPRVALHCTDVLGDHYGIRNGLPGRRNTLPGRRRCALHTSLWRARSARCRARSRRSVVPGVRDMCQGEIGRQRRSSKPPRARRLAGHVNTGCKGTRKRDIDKLHNFNQDARQACCAGIKNLAFRDQNV